MRFCLERGRWRSFVCARPRKRNRLVSLRIPLGRPGPPGPFPPGLTGPTARRVRPREKKEQTQLLGRVPQTRLAQPPKRSSQLQRLGSASLLHLPRSSEVRAAFFDVACCSGHMVAAGTQRRRRCGSRPHRLCDVHQKLERQIANLSALLGPPSSRISFLL